jgi:uncharacterized protein
MNPRATYHGVQLPEAAIADFCRRHCIHKLSLFGSILRPDFGPQSDVDVLVEFEAGRTPGFAFFDMQRELAEIVGRRVDLHTPGSISGHFLDQVLAEAQVQYAAA